MEQYTHISVQVYFFVSFINKQKIMPVEHLPELQNKLNLSDCLAQDC
jgi:hypothetical protein